MAIPPYAWGLAMDMAPKALDLIEKLRSGLNTKPDAAADAKLDELEAMVGSLEQQLRIEKARAVELAERREIGLVKVAGVIVAVGVFCYSLGVLTTYLLLLPR